MSDQFKDWLPLRDLSLSHLPRHGECAAVYAFREMANGHVLKFGHSGHIRNRIFKNYIGGTGGHGSDSTTQRIHFELFKNGWINKVEFAWLEASDKAEAERKEKAFRQSYMQSHGELPPWDRRW